MNRLIWGSLTFALMLTANVQAQRQPGGGGGFGGRGGAVALLSEKEMDELKLSSKQKDTISAIIKDYDAKQKEVQKEIQDLFTGGQPDREKMTKLRETITKGREAAETKLKAALDDDQKKKFDDLKKARPQRGFGGGGGGGFGGRGGAFKTGQVLPPGSAARLELTDDQKLKVEALEKKVKDALDKILTDDQKKKLEQGGGGRPGGGRPGAGGAGGRPGAGGGAGGRPRSDLDNK